MPWLKPLTRVSTATDTNDAMNPGGMLSFSVPKRTHLLRIRLNTYLIKKETYHITEAHQKTQTLTFPYFLVLKILSTNILCILRHLNFVVTVAITSSLKFVNEILVALKKKRKKRKEKMIKERN